LRVNYLTSYSLHLNHSLTRVLRVSDGTTGSHTASHCLHGMCDKEGSVTTYVAIFIDTIVKTLMLDATLILFAAVFLYADDILLLLLF